VSSVEFISGHFETSFWGLKIVNKYAESVAMLSVLLSLWLCSVIIQLLILFVELQVELQAHIEYESPDSGCFFVVL